MAVVMVMMQMMNMMTITTKSTMMKMMTMMTLTVLMNMMRTRTKMKAKRLKRDGFAKWLVQDPHQSFDDVTACRPSQACVKSPMGSHVYAVETTSF